ncbi:hypothetical protein Tco_1089254 [Tanacetum coccineum]
MAKKIDTGLDVEEEINTGREEINTGIEENKKKRKAQVQFEAQFYTEEDWDTIRAKLEANAELSKDVLGQDLPEQDFAKRMLQSKIKRYRVELQTKTYKNKGLDVKDVPAIGEKVVKVKEEEPVKRTGKRKKQKARLGQRSVYQIIRANGADTVYMRFGAMIKEFTREDLIELYRLVMQKYGTNMPEDVYDRVLWSDLRTMFDPPLNEDAIWSLPLQQKIISWRYYDKCEVHCLTLEACSIYMLAERKYPLSKDSCQVMLKMKLRDGKMNEVCYKLLKMNEKQAGVRK